MVRRCAKCNKTDANLLCSRCQCVHYCSAECQYAHWADKDNGHKMLCRECRDIGGVFFEGLQKSSILDIANSKGGSIARGLGYPVLTALSMALRVPRDRFIATLRHARGELTPAWQSALSFEEKEELTASEGESGTAPYVVFNSPFNAKKRKYDSPDVSSTSNSKRAMEATPLKLFQSLEETDHSHKLSKGQKRQKQLRRKDEEETEVDHVDELSDEAESSYSGSDGLEYEDVRVEDMIHESAEKKEYFRHINREFEDTEDGVKFRILSVCRSNDDKLGLFFKYRVVSEDEDDFEYTPCNEIMTASWVKWCDL